jgi:hypothetical protein
MATVTGMTAAAMQAIRDGAIVSAAFDSANHLILTKHDGTTVDGGALGVATTTLAGPVELATNAETQSGSSTSLAVTPAGLASIPGNKVQILSSVAETALPTSYPLGISLMNLSTGSGWSLNSGFGTVVTNYVATDRCEQTFYSNDGGTASPRAWIRSYSSTVGGGGWTSWQQNMVMNNLASASFTQITAASSYPVGQSRLFYTTANSTAWDFSGKSGEVVTYMDSSGNTKQTWTQILGGSTLVPDMWVRTSTTAAGWSKWQIVAGDSGWINLTYASGFTAGTAAQIQYRVRDGVIYFRGGATGTFTSGTYTGIVNPGAIPAAYAPSQPHRGGAMGSTMTPGGFEISTDGSIKLGWNNLPSAPAWLALATSYPVN